MASNLHKDLNDLQLHVPKGFSSASNSTSLQKDASGNLVWAAAGGGGATTTNVKVSINTTSVGRLKYDDIPITLVTGVALKIIQPISIICVGIYASGFQENGTTDLRAGWDAGTSGPLNIYWMGQRNFMNLKAVGTHTYQPPAGSTTGPFGFSAVGEDFQIYSTDVFNGNFSIDVYLNYTLIDA